MTDAYDWNRSVIQDADAYDCMADAAMERAKALEVKHGCPASLHAAAAYREQCRYNKAVARKIRELMIPDHVGVPVGREK